MLKISPENLLICTCEIFEKFVYKDSETMEYVKF